MSRKFKQNLTTMGETFAKQAAFTLSNLLRMNVEMEFTEVRQELFRDFLEHLSNPACVGIFNAEPMKGHGVLSVDAGMMFVILDRLLGGAGRPMEELRDFTEIESRIFTIVLTKMLNDLKEAAKKIVTLTVSFSRLESNPSFVNVMTGGERAIVLSHQLTIGEESGEVALCFSLAGFDPVMDRFEPKEEEISRRPEEVREDRRRIGSAIRESQLELVAELGRTTMSFRDLMELEEGQVIVLDQLASEPIPVRAGHRVLFQAEAGTSDNKKAVRLLRILRNGGRS
jgi:flagellar motor switch protein FliM